MYMYTGNIVIALLVARIPEDLVFFNSTFTGTKQNPATPNYRGYRWWMQSSFKKHMDGMNHKKKRRRNQRRRRK